VSQLTNGALIPMPDFFGFQEPFRVLAGRRIGCTKSKFHQTVSELAGSWNGGRGRAGRAIMEITSSSVSRFAFRMLGLLTPVTVGCRFRVRPDRRSGRGWCRPADPRDAASDEGRYAGEVKSVAKRLLR